VDTLLIAIPLQWA